MSLPTPVLERRERRLHGTNGIVVPPRRPGGDGGSGDDPSPHRPLLDNAVLAVLFLMGGETMFFAGLVSAFWVLRLAAPVWPPPLQPRLPVLVTGLNTIVLLASSVLVIRALRAHRELDRRRAVRRLAAAAALGALFVVVQGSEWVRLVRFGLTMSSSPYGSTFYTLIGAHAAHVVGALAWLALTAFAIQRGRLARPRSPALRACALYWHFVVGLWPLLYVSVYLL